MMSAFKLEDGIFWKADFDKSLLEVNQIDLVWQFESVDPNPTQFFIIKFNPIRNNIQTTHTIEENDFFAEQVLTN